MTHDTFFQIFQNIRNTPLSAFQLRYWYWHCAQIANWQCHTCDKKGVMAEKAWLHFTKITNTDSCNIWNDYFSKGEKHQQYTETPFYATWDSLWEVPIIWCSSTATFSMSSHRFTHEQKALTTCYISWEN